MKSNEDEYADKPLEEDTDNNIGGTKRSRSRSQSVDSTSKTTRKQVDEIQLPKKSRIPFDVTNMNYEQYCAK